MEISEKTSNLIQGGTAAAFGFMSWIKTATAKFENVQPTGGKYGVFDKNRVEDAIMLMIGPEAMRAIDPSFAGGGSQAFPNPLGAFNPTTFTGAGFLIADYVLKKALPPKYYKNLPVIPEVIKGIGIGVTVGGVIGGIWDPAPSPSYIKAVQNGSSNNSMSQPSTQGAMKYTAS